MRAKQQAGLYKACSRALVILIGAIVLAGCFQWTEDPQGNLRSVGVPGIPLWQSSQPAAPMSPTDLGFTPEQAAKLSGPVLVIPPAPPAKAYQYRYYETGQNHCQEDLQKLLESRAQEPASTPAPYCTDKPAAPENQGSGFIL